MRRSRWRRISSLRRETPGATAPTCEDLAVRSDRKPTVDRVLTSEVVRGLPVRIGPIGPQVNPRAVRFSSRPVGRNSTPWSRRGRFAAI